jgi:ubiquinone/menaquinone biosynthesis C-methylase UbiE
MKKQIDKDIKEKIVRYESEFKYGPGILNTPRQRISYFWDYYYKTLAPFLSNKIKGAERVIIVGIGSGDIVPFLDESEKRKIIGIDVNPESLQLAAQHVSVIESDASNMPFENGSADLVICNQVLHHIIGQGSLDATIRECYRILRKEGEFIAIEPNALHPSGIVLNIANRFHMYNYLTGGSDYEFSISPFYMRNIMKKNKFIKLKCSAVTYSHPRFPVALQKIINLCDKKLSRFYFAGLINLYTAVK